MLGALSAAPCTSLAAQESPSAPWTPATSAVGFGFFSIIGDGESSNRLGAYWYPRSPARLMVTSRLWDHYDVVEAEVRWLRHRPDSPRPFLMASAIWQNHVGQESIGGAAGAGVELYLVRSLTLEFTLAWQSLFAEAPYSDNHWFRITAGLSVVLFG